MTYLLLFGSAFIAATIFPFYSEAMLFGLIRAGEPALWLWAVATLGNTLGSVVNYFLGRYLLHFQHKRWFYFTPIQIERMQVKFRKYGVWSLLFAWLPVVGDPLTLVAGVMRVPFAVFLVLVALGKSLRYAAVIYFSQSSLNWF